MKKLKGGRKTPTLSGIAAATSAAPPGPASTRDRSEEAPATDRYQDCRAHEENLTHGARTPAHCAYSLFHLGTEVFSDWKFSLSIFLSLIGRILLQVEVSSE